VKHQVQNFESKFGILAERAYQEVSGKMEPSDFLSRVTYLPVSARTLHRSFIEKKLTNIPPPVTYVKIWATLNTYWDFLNYGFLEHVINKCGSEDLKQKIQTTLANCPHSNKQLGFVTLLKAGLAEMTEHQKIVSKRWWSK